MGAFPPRVEAGRPLTSSFPAAGKGAAPACFGISYEHESMVGAFDVGALHWPRLRRRDQPGGPGRRAHGRRSRRCAHGRWSRRRAHGWRPDTGPMFILPLFQDGGPLFSMPEAAASTDGGPAAEKVWEGMTRVFVFPPVVRRCGDPRGVPMPPYFGPAGARDAMQQRGADLR